MRSHFFLFFCVIAIGCSSNGSADKDPDNAERNSRNWSEIPSELTIDSLRNTDFVATLENKTEAGKNVVYAATMLYAWDEFRKIGGLVTVPDTASEDLKKLNSSRSHHDALDRGEYSVAGELVEGMIEVRAFFNKTLPFATEFQSTDPIVFTGDTVRSFGATFFPQGIREQMNILYFRSDSQFIISLNPADSAHQIIIAMGIQKAQTLADAFNKIKASIRTGDGERKRPANAWRYQLGEGDRFSIPEFRFNISKHYRTMEGQSVTTGTMPRQFAVAYQRTALVLNKYGAVAESEVNLTTDSSSQEVTKPKSMICDRPFYVIIQRKDRPNPYFMMKVEDSELMEKD
jgi:hypothetical protein